MAEVEEKLTKEITARDVPEEVSAWLGRLVLLYGVPFHYLIPEEEMLPPESIRFFYLDPLWIQYAIQGACSIGNTDGGDTMIDKAMNSLVQANQPSSGDAGSITTRAAASVRDRLRQQYEGIAMPEESQELAWPLTGFLLRSSVVRGWRGLEIRAYRTATDAEKRASVAKLNDEDRQKLKAGYVRLQALRIEQLSLDVMLGLFNGAIDRLIVRQPQESLHFGLTRRNGSFSKDLKRLGFKDSTVAGQNFDGNTIDFAVKKLMRVQSQPGVINVAALAAEMQSQLGRVGELEGGKFTSAEFAVEMIEAAGEFTFTPKNPAPRN
jgi:hypothetical protein